jgi:dihydroneopterin aldolase
MDKMLLERMEFYGYHGVYAEENKLGQQFVVDVELHLDLSAAGHSDELDQTINYAEVYQRVREIAEGKPFRLIEALAERIASTLLAAYSPLQQIVVRVTKPHPPFPIHFQGVTVEIVRKRV